jgi:hypothetical protein
MHIVFYAMHLHCRSSVVSIATTLRAGRYVFQILVGVRDLTLLRNVRTGPGAHPASYSKGNGVLSPGVKRPGREVNHSPPCSTEVKNV